MANSEQRVDVLFLHEADGDYLVSPIRDGSRLFRAILEIKETSAGPRPARLRIKQDSAEDPRSPDQFVELARRADRIRISEQTSSHGRTVLREMLDAFQLEATVVKTCRFCANDGTFSPLTEETAISIGTEEICFDCGRRELHRELDYRGGLSSTGRERLERLLRQVGDLERITELLKGGLDPDLTKVDEVSAEATDVDPVAVDELDLAPELASIITDRFDSFLPVQSLSIRNGLMEGSDQLVVSATATGKTLISELAGIDRTLRGKGKFLFLVPLVALANQKHTDFTAMYGEHLDVTIRVGASRIQGSGAEFDPDADVIVGTYEGIDHALRTGHNLGNIATVAIDEVHMLADPGRGHRLDGLITRLHHYCETNQTAETQWIYLSATVGNPDELADGLKATLIEYEDRPIPIERHLAFADEFEKAEAIDRLVTREFDRTSSKGFRGQTIVFTNSRRRCNELARKISYKAAPYHAGLDYGERKSVEKRFAEQDLAAVVATAALAAGVDFPASQVIFDSLAMGIEWLTVHEFEQMLGRAGRPDYHDRGVVYLLVEPEGRYHSGMDRSEDEVAFDLLTGEMESVRARYTGAAAIEETLANVVVAGRKAKVLNDRMIGDLDTRWAVGKLLSYDFIDGLEPTPLGRAVAAHFLSPQVAFTILEGIRGDDHPYDIVAETELLEAEDL